MENRIFRAPRGPRSVSAFAVALISALSLAGASRADEEGGLDYEYKVLPLKFGTATEYGKIVEGSEVESYGAKAVVSDQVFSKVSGWVTLEALVEDRLKLAIGLSGMFWYSLPVVEALPHTRLLKFGPGLHTAYGRYVFGDVTDPWMSLRMGFFPVKYNPDAQNLGEYLYRSGTYPGALWTGGWNTLNSAGYGAHGVDAAFDFLDGSLKLNATVFIERDIEPSFDLSPGFMAAYSPNPFFELGGGIVFSHLIAANEDRISPKRRDNAYWTDPATGKAAPLTKAEQSKPGLELTDTLVVADTDPRAGQPLPPGDPRENDPFPKYFTRADNGIPNSQLSYYTFRGQKVMARAAVNPLATVASLFEPGAGRIYAEVALLGIKDYPFYYEKKSERMPVMAGVNIPTFKLLDRLAFEVEYIKTPFQNNINRSYNKEIPIWTLHSDQARRILDPDAETFVDSAMAVTGDDLFWSLYARKDIGKGFRVFGQVAHDHMRVIDYNASPTYQPVIQKSRDWYWALRVEFGL